MLLWCCCGSRWLGYLPKQPACVLCSAPVYSTQPSTCPPLLRSSLATATLISIQPHPHLHPSPPLPSPPRPAPPAPPQSLLKASSPGAEALNGRLAMLGFAGVVATELATGRSLPEQLSTASGAGHAAALGLLVMAASLAPVLSGRVRPEQAFPSEVGAAVQKPG